MLEMLLGKTAIPMSNCSLAVLRPKTGETIEPFRCLLERVQKRLLAVFHRQEFGGKCPRARRDNDC